MPNVRLERIAESWSSAPSITLRADWQAVRIFSQDNGLRGDSEHNFVIDVPARRDKQSGPVTFMSGAITSSSLKDQNIPVKGLKVVCHEPVCLFTDGTTLAITSTSNPASLVEILGVASGGRALRDAVRITESGPTQPPAGMLPVAVVRDVD